MFFLSNIIVLNLLLKQVYFGFPIFRPLAQLMRDYFSKCASCAPDPVSYGILNPMVSYDFIIKTLISVG